MPWQIRKKYNQDGVYTVKALRTGKIINKGSTLEKCKAQVRYLGMLEGLKGGSIDDHSNVQSVIFKKEFNTIQQADKWLKEHDYKIDKSTYNFKTTNYLRYRQHDPDADAYDYRLKEIDPKRCIYLVLEYPKE
jgi:hypothetical protein